MKIKLFTLLISISLFISVMAEESNVWFDVDLQNLSAGVYIVKLIVAEQGEITQKIVVR